MKVKKTFKLVPATVIQEGLGSACCGVGFLGLWGFLAYLFIIGLDSFAENVEVAHLDLRVLEFGLDNEPKLYTSALSAVTILFLRFLFYSV